MTTQTLPQGWEETTLGAEFEWSSGGTPKSGTPAYYENGSIHWLNISDLNDGLIDCAEKQITELGLKESSAKMVKAGSVLIAIYGSIGKLGINTIPLSTNQAICFTKHIPEHILNKFLFYYLLSIRNKLISLGKGGTQQNISQTVLKAVPFSYPTKQTQTAIVQKIETLFAEIDAGIGCLKTAQTQLKQYRQALLKNAFNGALTQQWREQQADKLPSKHELLAQIQAARETHQAQQLADWQSAVKIWEESGKAGKKPSKPKSQTQAVQFDENFADLPNGWVIVKLQDVASIGSGMSISANRKLTSPLIVNYLRVGNVQRGYLDLKEIKEMQIEAGNLDKYVLNFGDVLFNEGGDRDKLGRGWVWENQIQNCITQNHVFRASPFYCSITHSKYISYLGNSQYGQRYFEETGKQTTNLASINKTVLSNFPIKLPSLAEQAQIVAILEEKLTACDTLANDLATQLKQAELLKQAVLKAAFSGGLTN